MTLDLAQLHQGTPGLTKAFGTLICEAASFSFETNTHQSGVTMTLSGCFGANPLVVTWPSIEGNAHATYNDPQFAAEFGAYGVAVLLVELLTDFTVVERSKKGTGFDFWLAPKSAANSPLFQSKRKLEVSGLYAGDESDLKSRVKQKVAQMAKGGVPLPGYGVVVHFPRPETRAAEQ